MNKNRDFALRLRSAMLSSLSLEGCRIAVRRCLISIAIPVCVISQLCSCGGNSAPGSELEEGLKDFDSGAYVAADQKLNKAVNHIELSGQKQDESVAQAYEALAKVRQLLGNYDGASAAATQALQIASTVSGPTSMDAADAMRTIADVVYLYAPDKAVELAKKALAIQMEHLSKEASARGRTLMTLALARSAQGEDHAGEAVSAAKAAVRIYRQMPDEPVQYARSLSVYTQVLGTYLDVDAQDPTYRARLVEEALEIERKQLGNSHPRVAADLTLLAKVEEGAKQRAQALEEALSINRKTFGSDHQEVCDDYALLSEVYAQLHRDGEALTARRKAAQGFQFSKGRINATSSEMLRLYASVFRDLGRTGDAKRVDEVLEARGETEAPDAESSGEKHIRIEQMVNCQNLDMADIDHLQVDWIDDQLWLNCYKEGEQVVHFKLKKPGNPDFRFEVKGPDTLAVGWKNSKDRDYHYNEYELDGREVKAL